MSKKTVFLRAALSAAMSAMLLIGCASKRDTITQAERMEKNRPGIAETRAMAEEGFIYGLPIVMNYASCTSTPSTATPVNSRRRSIRS